MKNKELIREVILLYSKKKDLLNYFHFKVGYEARNIDVKELMHNPDPSSTLFIPGL